MTMITPSYLGETIEYSSLHACRSTLEDPTPVADRRDPGNDGHGLRGRSRHGPRNRNGYRRISGFINAHLPAVRLGRDHVRYAYAGLRPLVDDGAADTYAASRRSELIDHRIENGPDGLLSVIGGKWTTSRALAEKTVDAAMQKLGRKPVACATAGRRLPGGTIDRISTFMNEARATGTALPNVDHLARLYGSRLPTLLAVLDGNPDLCRPLSPSGDIGAQILFAIREEMALTLEDVVMRRTGIGQEGDPGPTALESAATLMAVECGWSESRRRAEIRSVAAIFRDSCA